MTTDNRIFDEIEGLYKIIKLKPFRHTPGVSFDILPGTALPRIDSMDRVIHESGAVSPGPTDGVERPWYMHPHQADNLIILHGTRHVDIFSARHKKMESFEVSANLIRKNGTVLFEGPAMLVWPHLVFHRIRSSETGSASLNFAVHYDGFDIRTNFNIYDLDLDTGAFKVLREGHLDQT